MAVGSLLHASAACTSNHWSDDGLERDLYIETATVTVLAMDGRRRWLDIQELVSFSRAFICNCERNLLHYVYYFPYS
jgi:hypothetical protein